MESAYCAVRTNSLNRRLQIAHSVTQYTHFTVRLSHRLTAHTHNCNYIKTVRTALPSLRRLLQNSQNAQQHFVQISCSNFHASWTTHVDSTRRNFNIFIFRVFYSLLSFDKIFWLGDATYRFGTDCLLHVSGGVL